MTIRLFDKDDFKKLAEDPTLAFILDDLRDGYRTRWAHETDPVKREQLYFEQLAVRAISWEIISRAFPDQTTLPAEILARYQS